MGWLATSNPLNNRFSYQFFRVLNKLLWFKFTLSKYECVLLQHHPFSLSLTLSTHNYYYFSVFWALRNKATEFYIYWYDESFVLDKLFGFFSLLFILIWLNNRKLRSREYGVCTYRELLLLKIIIISHNISRSSFSYE